MVTALIAVMVVTQLACLAYVFAGAVMTWMISTMLLTTKGFFTKGGSWKSSR